MAMIYYGKRIQGTGKRLVERANFPAKSCDNTLNVRRSLLETTAQGFLVLPWWSSG